MHNPIFLLCDLLPQATFGKINLKNLKKLQKLDVSSNSFTNASGLKPVGKKNLLRIHDELSHKLVPFYIEKYINPGDIKYKKDYKFLPLANNKNQVSELPQKSLDRFNNRLENVVSSLEGSPERGGFNPDGVKSYIIGKALRKKKLTQVEKLITNKRMGDPTFDDLMKTKRQPTQDDVTKMINNVRNDYYVNKRKQPRLAPKTKGTKPTPTTIEEKKQRLTQKYGIQ